MTEEQLKQMLTEEVNAAAPDKEALWARIDAQLKPKTAPAKRKIIPRLVKINGFAAACAAVVLLVPAVLSAVNSGSKTDSIVSDGSVHNSEPSGGAANADSDNHLVNDISRPQDTHANNADSAAEDYSSSELLRYDELSFTSYSQTLFDCSGEPFGGEYFVEEDILAQTDIIIRARVEKVFKTDDGSGICYDVTVAKSFTEADIPEKITVVSRSPYPMCRGREYLLLLTEDENGYRTVFDSVPQTEYTADGGFVYYNGWRTLTTDSSCALLYTEQPDAFFYDRMMYSAAGDPAPLIAAWSDIRQA